MDICKAVVTGIVTEGPDAPFAIAFSPRFGIIEFSLNPDVWLEERYPVAGLTIMAGGLRRENDGWRAKEARLSPEPPPCYENDRGWSPDRHRRSEELISTIDQDNWAKREHSTETIRALRDLIRETKRAVHENRDTRAGMTWLEQSKFLQGLLATWWRLTKDRIA